jgi:hypothetical protein
VTAIANKLCEKDPFPYRYEVALEIAEAQVLLDRIKLARASVMERLRAAMTTERLDSEVEGTESALKNAHGGQKEGDKRLRILLSREEWADLNRSMAEGDARRVTRYVHLSTKRYKTFLKALRRGESAVHEFLATRFLYTVRPRPKPKPQPDMVSKLTTELGSLERYEKRACSQTTGNSSV